MAEDDLFRYASSTAHLSKRAAAISVARVISNSTRRTCLVRLPAASYKTPAPDFTGIRGRSRGRSSREHTYMAYIIFANTWFCQLIHDDDFPEFAFVSAFWRHDAAGGLREGRSLFRFCHPRYTGRHSRWCRMMMPPGQFQHGWQQSAIYYDDEDVGSALIRFSSIIFHAFGRWWYDNNASALRFSRWQLTHDASHRDFDFIFRFRQLFFQSALSAFSPPR